MNASLGAKEYNFNVQLKRWFNDPVAFRTVQPKCDALIIGDFARQFFSRKSSFTNDLVLSVDYVQYFQMVGSLQSDGYTPVDMETDLYCERLANRSGALSVYTKHHTDGAVRTVELRHETNYLREIPPVVFFLQTAATTTKLDFIPWNKAYSLALYTTYIQNEPNPLCGDEKLLEASSAQHVLEGIQDMDVSVFEWWSGNGDLPSVDARICCTRRIQDSHTWIMKLAIDGVSVPVVPDYVLEAATFEILPTFPHFEMCAQCVLSHPILQFRYVTFVTPDGFYCFYTSRVKKNEGDARWYYPCAAG